MIMEPNRKLTLDTEQECIEAVRHGQDKTHAPGNQPDNDDNSKHSEINPIENIQLNYIVNELISTEINYLRDLHFLLQNFLKPIRSILETEPDLRIAQKVCNYTKMIHRLGTNFLDDLVQAHSDIKIIGSVFVQYKTLFNLYPKLSKVWNCYMKLVLKPSIDQAIKKQEEELKEAIGFGRYMLKPIQRLTKYELLLNEMLKKVSATDGDSSRIVTAVDFIRSVLNRCNSIVALESIEYNKYDECQAGRYIMKTDLTWRVPVKKKKMSMQVELFLFEKVVIIAVDVQGTLQYRDSILISRLTRVDRIHSLKFILEEVQNAPNHPRVIHLEAPSMLAKQKCLQSIDKLLWRELESLKQQQAETYGLDYSST